MRCPAGSPASSAEKTKPPQIDPERVTAGHRRHGGCHALPCTCVCVCVCPGLTWLSLSPPALGAAPAPRPHGRSGGAAHRRAVSEPLRSARQPAPAWPRWVPCSPTPAAPGRGRPQPRLLLLPKGSLSIQALGSPHPTPPPVPDPRSCCCSWLARS